MGYQKLAQALNDSVKMYTPDVLYPRECLIVDINEDDTLKIIVNIGENIYLDEVRYIGIPKINTTGLFIPLNNNYDEGYCICYNETTESLTENVIINNINNPTTEKVNEVNDSEEETSEEITNEVSEETQVNINYDRRYAKINHTHTENVGTIEDLKTLIKNTKEGNILSLNENFKNERYGNIIINKKITIDGNGHSIENISFTCDADEIELNNITFFNVTTNRVNGGALQLNGQKISINNCIFYNNIINGTSVYEGGAISVNSSSIETKITDCYFIDNFCSNNGGAIRWIANNGVLIGCKFIGNTATNNGGAIKWLGTNGFIRNCLFKDNKATNGKDILTSDDGLLCIGNVFLNDDTIIGTERVYDYITEYDKKEIEDEIHSSFGRNILYNTQEMIVSTPPNNISYDGEFRNNKVVCFDDESSNGNGYRDWYYDIPIDEFNYNDEFTLSFWIKSNKENIGKIKAYFTGDIKNKVISSNGYDYSDAFNDGHIVFDVNDGWKKCFVTWKLDSTGDSTIQKRLIIRIFDGAEIYLSSPKLERGEVSTDWTPNPNDKISNYQIIGREYIDLNNIRKTGIYRCESNSNIENLPLDFQGIPFVLEVVEIGNDSCRQRITFNDNVKTFEYIRTMKNSNWSQWQMIENQVHCICHTTNATGSDGFGKLMKIKNTLPTTNYNATIGFDVYQKNKKFPVRCYLKFKNENIENFNIDSFYYYGENSDIYIINSNEKEWDLYVKKYDEEDVMEIKNLTINDTYTTKENKLEFYPLNQETTNDDFLSIYDETDTHSAKAVKSDYCLDKEQTDGYYLSLNGGNINGNLNVNDDLNVNSDLNVNGNISSGNIVTELSTSSTDEEIPSAKAVYDEFKVINWLNEYSWETYYDNNIKPTINNDEIVMNKGNYCYLKYEFTHNKCYEMEFDFICTDNRNTGLIIGGNKTLDNWYEIVVSVNNIRIYERKNGTDTLITTFYNTFFNYGVNKIKMIRNNDYLNLYVNDELMYEFEFKDYHNIIGMGNIGDGLDSSFVSIKNIKIYNTSKTYTYKKVEIDEKCKNRWDFWGQYQGMQSLTNTNVVLSNTDELYFGGYVYTYYGEGYDEPIELTLKLTNNVSVYVSKNRDDLYNLYDEDKLTYNVSKNFTLDVKESVYVLVRDKNGTAMNTYTANINYEVKDIVRDTINNIVDIIYPVGAIYMSVNNVNPNILFGGQWEQLKDRFLLGSGDVYTGGATGGSANAVVVKHNHTQNAHNHTASADGKQSFLTAPTGSSWNEIAGGNVSGSGYHYVVTKDKSNYNVWVSQSANKTATNQESGVDGTGKNMPPYLTVYMWKRIG